MLLVERDPRELPREGDWLTATEAADKKGVSRQFLVRAIKRGDLRGLRWGRFYVVHKSDLEAWRPAGRGRPRKDRPNE